MHSHLTSHRALWEAGYWWGQAGLSRAHCKGKREAERAKETKDGAGVG